MEKPENSYLKGVAVQATAIFLAALGAGVIAFAQSFATQSGLCPAPSMTPEEAGILGGLFKSIHSALMMRHGIV